jgi:hypothetical protein
VSSSKKNARSVPSAPPPEPPQYTEPALAVTIQEAAHMVGVSRTKFYSLYIGTGRVKPLVLGGHSRVIDVAELRSAYSQLRSEARGAANGEAAGESPGGSP